ncbi:MAG: hypothetical protein P1U56_19095 [Saprospiraceae bacterium]|nr:hypothetical protein [Saprospiraceae bacterium]
MNSKTLRTPIIVTLGAFFIATLLGLGLRGAFVLDMPEWFNYRHVQHAHSHVALLGWLFAIFTLSIIHFFDLEFEKYAKLYWSLQAMVVGMLITFPIMGYASLSIFFSTGHIIVSYILVVYLWRDLGKVTSEKSDVLFVKTSLAFMVLSTLGTWALGPILALKMKGTAIYYASIQFYLHFQFNGWFIFAMLGILLAILRKRGINFGFSSDSLFYRLLTVSAFLTYALAITWSTPYLSIFLVNSIGVLLQLIALSLLLIQLKRYHNEIKHSFNKYVYWVFCIALIALIIKIVVQAAVVIPYMAAVSYTIRNFVIGFIHLLLLGCLSMFAFGCISIIMDLKLDKIGTLVFVTGIICTEAILFIQGLMLWMGQGFIPSYYLILAVFSLFILIGLLIVLVRLIQFKSMDEATKM